MKNGRFKQVFSIAARTHPAYGNTNIDVLVNGAKRFLQRRHQASERLKVKQLPSIKRSLRVKNFVDTYNKILLEMITKENEDKLAQEAALGYSDNHLRIFADEKIRTSSASRFLERYDEQGSQTEAITVQLFLDTRAVRKTLELLDVENLRAL